MKEIKAFICDDEVLAEDLVASALDVCFKKYGYLLSLDKYTNPAELENAPSLPYQLAFLDIDMPTIDGIELAKKLKQKNDSMDIIFVSNCEDRVFDSLAVRPFGFVRKSSFLKDVESVVKLYIGSMKDNDSEPSLEIKVNGTLLHLELSTIVFIECQKDSQLIHLKSQKEAIRVYLKMADLEDSLKGHGFLRVHQGYLVNYRYIVKIGKEDLTLTDNTQLPVSRRKRKEVFTQYMRYSRLNDNVVKIIDEE